MFCFSFIAEYNIMMFDSKHKERRWNVTYYDYSSNVMDSEALNNYGIKADHNNNFIINSKSLYIRVFIINSLSRFKNVFLAIFGWKYNLCMC
jgi:hypothetical protein